MEMVRVLLMQKGRGIPGREVKGRMGIMVRVRLVQKEREIQGRGVKGKMGIMV